MLRKLMMAAALVVMASQVSAQHDHPAGDPRRLGKVNFEISCREEVRAPFQRAMALLHSFWYAESEKAFAEVAAKDPKCAMAYWGIAMSVTHPLWEAPDKETSRRGWETVQKARAAATADDRERAYVAAIETFYRDYETLNHLTRTKAYEQAMQKLVERYPQDVEARMFYALALLGTATASPPDRTYARQKQAGAIAEKLLPAHPEHPGVAHYIIHSYDFPPLAERGLAAARRYAKIAPDAPHALHMPSHIFTRLGLWDESIASNLDSAAAARKYHWPGEELHAMDYLVYAYLQQGRDEEARKIVEALPAVAAGEPSYFAGLHARAAIPARYVVERRRWSEAATLEIPANMFPGGRYAWTEANFYFTRALGAVRSGRPQDAGKPVEKLEQLRQALLEAKEAAWADQVGIQQLAAMAWVAHAEGKQEEALRLMRSAAEREEATDKHPVTPGAIVPARELLGEMLLEMHQPAEALAAFRTVLSASPGRLQALFGAAQAAERSGQSAEAREFYARLLENCRKADTDRPELRAARAVMAAKR